MIRPALVCELAELLDSISPAEADNMEREAMADSGLYQDIDSAAPNYWQSISRYSKARRLYNQKHKES